MSAGEIVIYLALMLSAYATGMSMRRYRQHERRRRR